MFWIYALIHKYKSIEYFFYRKIHGFEDIRRRRYRIYVRVD